MKQVKILLATVSILFSTVLAIANPNRNYITVVLKNGSKYVYDARQLRGVGFSNYDSEFRDMGKVVSNYFCVSQDSIDSFKIEDIDSVAFGGESSIRAKADAIAISDDALQYVKSFDGESGIILFKPNTPSKALPIKGKKVYYATPCQIFPNGLCAEVISVGESEDGVVVNTKSVEPNTVFDEFFICSDYESEEREVEMDSSDVLMVEGEDDEGDEDDEDQSFALRRSRATIFDGQISYFYKANVKLTLSHVQFDALKGNVFAKINLDIDCDYTINHKNSQTLTTPFPPTLTYYSKNTIHVPLGIESHSTTSWFNPKLDMDLKFVLKVNSINMDLKGKRRYRTSFYCWMVDGEATIFKPEITSNEIEKEEGGDKKNPHITFMDDSYLKGSASLLANFSLYMHPFLRSEGLKVLISTGPTMKGTIGRDELEKMSKSYLADNYKNSCIESNIALKATGFLTKYKGEEVSTATKMPATHGKLAGAIKDGKYYMFPQFYSLNLTNNEKGLEFEGSSATRLVNDLQHMSAFLYDKQDSTIVSKKEDISVFYKNIFASQHMETQFGYDGILTRDNVNDFSARPLIKYDDSEVIGPNAVIMSCENNKDGHPHLIDLDLPSGTMWACMNVGAKKPSDFGDYFTGSEMLSAVKRMGDDHDYKVPTLSQILELIEHTKQEWVTVGSTTGMIFVGKNGQSVFFPAAAQYWNYDDWEINNEGSGAYWTQTLSNSPGYNYFMEFNHEDGAFRGDRKRSDNKLPIRAVCVEKKD